MISDVICSNIINKFNNNDTVFESMDMFSLLLDGYLNCYRNKDTLEFNYLHTDFRIDTKRIFNIIINTYANEIWGIMMEAFDDFNNDNDDNDDENVLKEKNLYLTFCYNVQYVFDHIDNVDLIEPDEQFIYNCHNSISYLNLKKTEQKEFNETLGDLTSTLTNLRNVLEQITEP